VERRKDYRPDYEKKVDQDLFAYRDAHRIIKIQTDKLETIALTGRKVTATYELIEGGRGGPVNIPEENITLKILECEELIRRKREYIETIEAIIADSLPEAEYRQFVKLYWWTCSRHTPIRMRMAVVLAEMPFLEYVDTRRRRRKRDLFYDWRNRIYRRLAEALGYLEGVGE